MKSERKTTRKLPIIMATQRALDSFTVTERAHHAVKVGTKGCWSAQEIAFAKEILRLGRAIAKVPHIAPDGKVYPPNAAPFNHVKESCADCGGRCAFENHE